MGAPCTEGPWIHSGSFGGNVGPVGSQHERNMLTVITGQPATEATELLLGPVARGTTVSLTQSASTGRPEMKFRGPLIGLSLFMVVALTAHLAGVCEPATGRGRENGVVFGGIHRCLRAA